MILSPKWQAALRWYLTWSAGDLGGVRSAQAGAVAQLEMRTNLKRHRDTDRLSGPLECNPTPSWTAVDHAVDEMLQRVESVALERQVRFAWHRLLPYEQEELFLAHVAEHAMRPELIAPLLSARAAFGPWRLLADRTPAAAEAAQREQTRVHRRVQVAAVLDKLNQARGRGTLGPDQALEVKRIALGCEHLAGRAGEIFMRGVTLGRAA